MANEVQVRPAGLPGISEEADADALIAAFSRAIDGTDGWDKLPRLPTAAEREVLLRRAEQIRRTGRPAGDSPTHKADAIQALALMFSGYPSLRSADAAKTCSVYLLDLQDLPLFAIKAACEDVRKQRVPDLSPDYPPTSARLYKLGKEHAAKNAVMLAKAERVLRVELLQRPAPSAEEQAAVGEAFQALAEDLRFKADEEDRACRQAAVDGFAEMNQRLIEDEYAALGIEPIQTGGFTVSPTLARKLGAFDTKKTGRTRR